MSDQCRVFDRCHQTIVVQSNKYMTWLILKGGQCFLKVIRSTNVMIF